MSTLGYIIWEGNREQFIGCYLVVSNLLPHYFEDHAIINQSICIVIIILNTCSISGENLPSICLVELTVVSKWAQFVWDTMYEIRLDQLLYNHWFRQSLQSTKMGVLKSKRKYIQIIPFKYFVLSIYILLPGITDVSTCRCAQFPWALGVVVPQYKAWSKVRIALCVYN